MLLRLILLLTLVPFLELYLLLWTASTFGVAQALLLCLVTGVVGGSLAHREGLAVWTSFRQQLASGTVPAGPLLEGALVFGGGLLLLTPGIATDVLGFALVLPPTRAALAMAIARRLQGAIQSGAVQVHMVRGGPPQH